MHSVPIEKIPLFVHPPYFDEDQPDLVIYNACHPLIARLLNGEKPKDEAAIKAIYVLTHRIERFLWHLWEKASSSTFKRNQELEESANFNYTLIGILKYYPEIFKEFYDAIELYWEEAKNLGVISPDEDFIDLSLDDLPWFWNYDLTDFKDK
jgi:molecular chaperone HtpG